MDEIMTTFNNGGKLFWFPVMKTPSKKSYAYRPGQRCLRVEYGPHVRYLPPKLAADLAGVSVKTVYKWIAGTQHIDARTRAVLYSRALGLIPHEAWQGWHVDETGRLTAPNGWTFCAGELLGLTYLKQLNGELQRDVARLTVENRQLREAVNYLQANRLPANVVRFPGIKKPDSSRANRSDIP
jgi:hypothetical protein